MTRRYRLAVVALRPQPYHSALFRPLAAHPQLDLTVYYLLSEGLGQALDPDYGRFQWGYPVLEGYRSRFPKNRAPCPGAARFFGSFHAELFRLLHPRFHDAAIIPGWFPFSVWLAWLASWKHGLPILLRCSANAPDPVAPWSRRLKRSLLPQLFKRCGAFLALGTRNAEFYRGYGVPEEKLFLTPHAVDNDFFQQQRVALFPRRAELRQQLGIPPSGVAFLYAGRLAPEKRLGDLLAAAARLANSRIWLILAGEGRGRARLEEQVRSLGLRQVLFPGFQSQAQLARLYSAADVFVLPSQRELWGLVVNEAMNFALPVVVSERVGAAPDLVKPGGNGLVFPPGDLEALTGCLRTLAADAALRARLGRASLERIRNWSHTSSVETILRAVEFSISSHGAPQV